MKKLVSLSIVAILLAVAVVPAFAAGTVYYTGQGFTFDGSTWIINDERCAQGAEANDGGTGQFANWNGIGIPFQTGDPYLLWILTANGATSATITLPDGSHAMFKVGGTFKYASQYWSPDELIGVASATWVGGPNKANLTVSHGCAGHKEGAWCSPGYWKNTLSKTPTNGWTTIGVDPTTAMFNGYVSPDFYANDLSPDQLLTYVLDHPGDFGGQLGTAGPFGLTAYNAVGAYLTSLIEGYEFDPALVGDDEACPIDAFGRYKDPSKDPNNLSIFFGSTHLFLAFVGTR